MIYVHAAGLNIAQQSQPCCARHIHGARHGARKGGKNRYADAHGLLRYFRGNAPAADDHMFSGVQTFHKHVAHKGINGVVAANIKAVKNHALPVEQSCIVAAACLVEYFGAFFQLLRGPQNDARLPAGDFRARHTAQFSGSQGNVPAHGRSDGEPGGGLLRRTSRLATAGLVQQHVHPHFFRPIGRRCPGGGGRQGRYVHPGEVMQVFNEAAGIEKSRHKVAQMLPRTGHAHKGYAVDMHGQRLLPARQKYGRRNLAVAVGQDIVTAHRGRGRSQRQNITCNCVFEQSHSTPSFTMQSRRLYGGGNFRQSTTICPCAPELIGGLGQAGAISGPSKGQIWAQYEPRPAQNFRLKVDTNLFFFSHYSRNEQCALFNSA